MCADCPTKPAPDEQLERVGTVEDCPVCLEDRLGAFGVRLRSCSHAVCVPCAAKLCSEGFKGSPCAAPRCPLCRRDIEGFEIRTC